MNKLNVALGVSELVKKLGLCVAVGLGECVIKLRNLWIGYYGERFYLPHHLQAQIAIGQSNRQKT